MAEENEMVKSVIKEMNSNVSPYSQSNPMRADDLRDSYDPSIDMKKDEKEKKKITELENQINELTSSVSQLQKNVIEERRTNNDLVSTHNAKINDLMNKIDELKDMKQREYISANLSNVSELEIKVY